MSFEHEKIGNVKITRLNKTTVNATYSDGDVEDDILKLYKNGLSETKRRKILENDPSWAIRYHLSYERSNLLNWYNFEPGSSVLEVGSGCGAITEVLTKNELHVVANELSERRASINAYRNKEASNLEMVIGNLQDYKPEKKFDYVVCVGVLEYAGTFIDSSRPYDEFITLLSSFLKPGGTVLLAIENKLGFKYLSGAKEDHTGGYFDGINNYPQQKNVRTFGKLELTDLFVRNNLLVNRFYYPHPDYKIPQVVYSDEFLPGVHTSLPKNTLPSPNFDQDRQHLFSEENFVTSLESNAVFADFANSFLVEATLGRKKGHKNKEVVFGLNRTGRGEDSQIRTSGIIDQGKLLIRKEALKPSAREHINRMAETYKELERLVGQSDKFRVAAPKNVDVRNGSIDFEYIRGKTAEDLLLKSIIEEDYEKSNEIISTFREILAMLTTDLNPKNNNKLLDNSFGGVKFKDFDAEKVIKNGIIDLNLDNFIVSNDTNQWWLIDYEWRLDFSIPTQFVEYRTILSFAIKNRNILATRSRRERVRSNNILSIPQRFLDDNQYSLKKLNTAYELENTHFQPLVQGNKTRFDKPTEFTDALPQEYFIERAHALMDRDAQTISLMNNQISDLRTYTNGLEEQLEQIQSSRSYKISLKASRAKHKVVTIVKKGKKS